MSDWKEREREGGREKRKKKKKEKTSKDSAVARRDSVKRQRNPQ